MAQTLDKRIAAGAFSVGLAVYLAKGGIDWLPNSIPLTVMACGGAYWLYADDTVRVAISALFRTEIGVIIHPETKQPAQRPRLRLKRASLTVLSVAIVVFLFGGFMWRLRAHAFDVFAEPEFVASGARPNPFGGPEVYSATTGLSIDNKTRYATGLTNWKVSLKFKDGKLVEGSIPFATDKDVPLSIATYDGHQLNQLTLKANDYLPLKGASPIPPGGGAWGWIPALFEGYTRADVRGKGATLIVEFDEIATGKHHTVTDYLDAPSQKLPPGIFHIRKKPDHGAFDTTPP